jgi:autotransporter-associated beta strand protein
LVVSTVPAGIREDVGASTLEAALGYAPTGAGVHVSMTEAGLSGNYVPMTSLPDFVGKNFLYRSGASGNSSHATLVAQNFFGLSGSIAPGIDTIELYEANNFMNGGFLRMGSRTANPMSSPQNSRVGNHSWVHGISSVGGNLDVLQRMDWVIEGDDYIEVVGVNNGSVNTSPLLSNGFNVISVGRSDGNHAIHTVELSDVYRGYRTRPDIVAPMEFTSFAAPVVAAASALLVETGHANPWLSNGTYVPDRFPGTAIYHAETSEVVKAALLAGASRLAFNSNDGSAIVDYRQLNRQSNNGLDKRFGAGQLDVHNSYNIIASGEQDSRLDGRSIDIEPAGFDYDPHFGGANGSNTSGVYEFTAGWTGQSLTASLVWNANIDIERVKDYKYSTAATVYDLNLSLYDITTGTPQLVAMSASSNQNSENLWNSLTGGRRYRLEVSRPTSQAPFDWDYGLAWSTVGTIGWRGFIWDNLTTPSWIKGNVQTGYLPGEHVVFSDWGTTGSVPIVGLVAPGSVTVDSNLVNYTFHGNGTGEITGATGIVKRGSAMLTLVSANSYTGPTLIHSGTVSVMANDALGTAARGTTVWSGGALVLAGTVNYSTPEPLTLSGQGPWGSGAFESTGAQSRFAGPVTVNGFATIGVTAGDLAMPGGVQIPAAGMLSKAGQGELALQGSLDWGASSTVSVSGGTLRLEPAAAANVTVASSPTLIIGDGAVKVNATAKDPFTDQQNPSQHVNIINNAVDGLQIEAGSVSVGNLFGSGTTQLADGALLSADAIRQAGLELGTNSRVTIRPGQSSPIVLQSLTFGLATQEAVWRPPAEVLAGPDSSLFVGSLDLAATSGTPAAVPEPASVLLVSIGAGFLFLSAVRHRRRAFRTA